LVEARTAEATLRALARVDSLRLGGRRYTLVGGVAVDSSFLARLAPDSDLAVSLALPTDTLTRVDSAAQVVRALPVPFVELRDAPGLGEARIVVTHSLAPLVALRRRVDAAFAAAVLLTGAIALLLASWLSSWISRPLRELARRTAEIDMERLDVAFESDRDDEIGALSRLLGAMTERLRAGAARLREAERRIAVGDLARQVNHDIKNGLIPIRNVFRHLLEAARGGPDGLAAALRDRDGRDHARRRWGWRPLRRADHRRGHGQRHEPGGARSGVRRLLHHQAGRHGPRPLDRAAPGARRQRRAPRGDRARGGQQVHCRAAGRRGVTTVLVVDDVPAMAEQYAYDLKRVGAYDALVAHGGREALATLEREAVDCVILD